MKPLIWIEAVVEPYSGSRIEYMIKAKSQFKARSVANNVEVPSSYIHIYVYIYIYMCIPMPPDAGCK